MLAMGLIFHSIHQHGAALRLLAERIRLQW